MVCFLARNARKGNTTQRSQRRNELSAADPQIFKSPQDFPFAPSRETKKTLPPMHADFPRK
jgi:hypothetical protein